MTETEATPRLDEIRQHVYDLARETLHGPVPLKTTMALVTDADYLLNRVDQLEQALRFCRDIAEEEHAFTQFEVGAEAALRHIARRARAALRDEEG